MATIIVLDDELDAAHLIRRILEQKGHKVFPFTEEEEALTFATNNAVDLAILEMNLKKMDGLEVLSELRRLAPATLTMILTGYPTIETAEASYHLGAAEYCVKPIDNDELEQKVNQLLTTIS